jgi:hypothetical protein
VAMDLYFADWSLVSRMDASLVGATASRRRVPDRTPILVDDAMRPVEPCCTFLRRYCQNLRQHTVVAYARDALELGRFLEARGVGVLDVSESDLVAYRADRFASGLVKVSSPSAPTGSCPVCLLPPLKTCEKGNALLTELTGPTAWRDAA